MGLMVLPIRCPRERFAIRPAQSLRAMAVHARHGTLGLEVRDRFLNKR